MTDDYHGLPTPRTTLAASYVAVLVWCKSCRHQAQVDLQKLIRGEVVDLPASEPRAKGVLTLLNRSANRRTEEMTMPGLLNVPPRRAAKAAATKAQPNKGTNSAKSAAPAQLQRTAAAISQAAAKAGQGGTKRR